MLKGLLVFLGAGLGGLARYGVGLWVQRPWGTLTVNVLGCFAMGVLLNVAGERSRAFLLIGVLGGFTTFSSFGADFDWLLRERSASAAFGYAAASVLLSLAAVALGRGAGKLAGL